MPFASAIDSDLSPAHELVHPPLLPPNFKILIIYHPQTIAKASSKPPHVRLPEGPKQTYEEYGPLSVAEWHKEHGVWVG